MNDNKKEQHLFKSLERITYLLEHLLALELSKTDLNWSEIAKHLKVNKVDLNNMLKGTKSKKGKRKKENG